LGGALSGTFLLSHHLKSQKMNTLTLNIKNIDILNEIKTKLLNNEPLSTALQEILIRFLSQLPSPDILFQSKIEIEKNFKIKLLDFSKIDSELDQWIDLFGNLPGWDYCPFVYRTDFEHENLSLLQKNVILVVVFAPSLSYNEEKRKIELHLKTDGSAEFILFSFRDVKEFPALYNFKGDWKAAYFLLIKILKIGWPLEEFPIELMSLLKVNNF